MHAQNSALRKVNNWGAHHAAEHTSVCDSKRATSHVFNGNLAITSSLSKVCKLFLKMMETHFLNVSDNWDNKSCWCWNCSWNINEVAVYSFVAFNHSVDYRLFFQSLNWGSHESWHETKLYSMLLGESLLDFVACINNCWHIDFIESRQTCISVLWLLETTSNSLSHLVHRNSGFNTTARNFWWCLFADNSRDTWFSWSSWSSSWGSRSCNWCWLGSLNIWSYNNKLSLLLLVRLVGLELRLVQRLLA